MTDFHAWRQLGECGGCKGCLKCDPDGHGGLRREDVTRAKNADLITLPPGVKGTNCGNCSAFRKDGKVGHCADKRVNMPVNERMCCSYWDNKKTYRPWSGKNKFEKSP